MTDVGDWKTSSTGATPLSSGVVGLEGKGSSEAEWNVASEATEDVGCGSTPRKGDVRVVIGGGDGGGTKLSRGLISTGAGVSLNQGWSNICAIVRRFEGSMIRMFLIKSRASVKMSRVKQINY